MISRSKERATLNSANLPKTFIDTKFQKKKTNITLPKINQFLNKQNQSQMERKLGTINSRKNPYSPVNYSRSNSPIIKEKRAINPLFMKNVTLANTKLQERIKKM